MQIHQRSNEFVLDAEKRNFNLKCKDLSQRLRQYAGDFRSEEDSIKVMTMHSSNGLELPVVTSDEGWKVRDVKKDGALEARLFYVA